MSSRSDILPPGSTALERAFDQVTARSEDLDTGISRTWSAEACPAELLPWLAWALSVDYWGEDWAVDLRRSVVAASVETHRRKGTIGAVRRALEAAGLRVNIVEWWQNGEAVHTFELTALATDFNGLSVKMGPELAALVRRTVDPVKPARSHYTIQIGQRDDAAMALRAGMRGARTHRMTMVPEMPATRFGASAGPAVGLRRQRRFTATITPRIDPLMLAAGAALRTGMRRSLTNRQLITFSGSL